MLSRNTALSKVVLAWLHALLLLLFAAPALADFTPTKDFTDNGDGTVTHQLTGLTWMRCAIGQTWTGTTCSGTPTTHTFDQAKALTSTFAGHSDWRLPSPWELGTIVDYDIGEPGPTINSIIFPNLPANLGFWSGSPSTVVSSSGSSNSAWGIGFNDGHVGVADRSSVYSVRLVRNGQPFALITTPTSDFTDNGDGTVTHKKTQLTWMRCALGQTWSGSTCTGTDNSYYYSDVTTSGTFAGQSDWRMPNVQELQSIVEYSDVPSINTVIFPNTPSSQYFSTGSTYASHSSYQWGVSFGSGRVSDIYLGNRIYARLARIFHATTQIEVGGIA